ncbi:MAG: hypothetical protein KDD69_17375 [Bdellovibrionales bacterium]|nr:hypothetical protein [Bdellovibrionales bacterium]
MVVAAQKAVRVRQCEETIRPPLPAGRPGRKDVPDEVREAAKRTAFVARFIVLREGRRSRAHRLIEAMTWEEETTAAELYKKFRDAFIENGDKLGPVDRDLKRALEHASCSADYFVEQYADRTTLSFREALEDYERSNRLLFGDDPHDVPRSGGWRLPSDPK